MKTKLLTLKKQLLFLMLAIGSLYIFAQDGALDTSFDPGTGANSTVETTSIQADGKIIIGGWFTSYNGTNINRIARLNDDGTLDNTFDPGTGPNNTIRTTFIQVDGKIIIGGNFTSYNGDSSIKYLARLNADGTLDSGFNTGGAGASSSVYTTYVQDDGKILIGGNFTSYNGTGSNYLARLNADGTLDTGFNSGGAGANWYVRTIAVQTDGKIIIGGGFSSYNGASRYYIVRLNADGTLDTSFSTGTAANGYIRTIAVQTDGKIIIGGEFLTYAGTNRNGIARLNADGTHDTSFDPGTGALYTGSSNTGIWTTAIQDDGKIIIGGYSSTFNGTVINRIARLNADGSLDNTFDQGAGVDSVVLSNSIQTDGKIIIGGGFTTYNGTARSRIARLNGSPTAGINENSAIASLSLFPNPAKNKFTIDIDRDAKYSLISTQGQELRKGTLYSGINDLDVSSLSNGLYFLNIETAEGKATKKLIKE